MRNINKVILIGNIARDPEVRVTNGGQKMATFVLATNRTWHDPNGGKQSQAEFHNMLAWGKIAEICEKFLQKSTLVYVEGYLKTRSWEHESGVRLYRTEVVIQDILVLDKGVRHDDYDQGEYEVPENTDFRDFSQTTKPATEIEKGIQNRLNEGNQNKADVAAKANSSENDDPFLLDTPLFEEEQK